MKSLYLSVNNKIYFTVINVYNIHYRKKINFILVTLARISRVSGYSLEYWIK